MLTSVAVRGEGVTELVEAFDAHHERLEQSGELERLRREGLARHTRDVVDRALSNLVWQERDGAEMLADKLDDLVSGRISPYKVAHDIVAHLQEAPE